MKSIPTFKEFNRLYEGNQEDFSDYKPQQVIKEMDDDLSDYDYDQILDWCSDFMNFEDIGGFAPIQWWKKFVILLKKKGLNVRIDPKKLMKDVADREAFPDQDKNDEEDLY